MADLNTLKGISEQDRRMIADAEALLGPEPGKMGWVKNLFWGRVRGKLVFPYPTVSEDEKNRCDALLARLDHYLRSEHPAVQIDQGEEIPRWVIDRLFELGVLGMTIPREFGGGGLGITSYNRVLERIGRYCGSTAVLVSAHQSIGCRAIMLFGTEEQKKKYLPKLATEWLSAFCLSEPNVGCDAGGQETRCELAADGSHYVLNGEKKWATSGAISGLFTVMCKQKMGDGKERVTALICTPEMAGVDIFQKNRSKCGIRGTWQARIRFKDVKVPRENLLHLEGKGLNVALTCLDYGRCTLSAGMLGGARRAFEQGTKWAQTRFQFHRAIAEFELVQEKIARMSALTYAMDAVLYMTTGMLDRGDEDIMLETALCKIFCSEMGWRVVNDCVQIMGGESYMVENEIERIFRDSRINLIVEGANEVMQSFVFAYGGKQLAEMMLGVQQAIGWEKMDSVSANLGRIFRGIRKPGMLRAAVPLGMELFLGRKPRRVGIEHLVDASLREFAQRLSACVAELSHQFKVASMRCGESIVGRQCVQARLADAAMWVHGWGCVLSKVDGEVRGGKEGLSIREAAARLNSPKSSGGREAAEHFMRMAEEEIGECFRRLRENTDASMHVAAKAAMEVVGKLPNSDYVIHEASPNAAGTGKSPARVGIRMFSGENGEPLFPSPSIPGEGQGEGRSFSAATKRPSPQPSPGVPGEGERPIGKVSELPQNIYPSPRPSPARGEGERG